MGGGGSCPPFGVYMDKVTICNFALNFIGQRQIASLDEDSPAAQLSRLYYDEALRTVLSDHNWNFAQRRRLLNRVETSPEWEPLHKFAYNYPVDALRIIGIKTPYGRISKEFYIAYHDDRTVIYSNVPSAVAFYVSKVDDPNRYSPQFVQALARKLQVLITVPITKSLETVQAAEEMYRIELSRAIQADAREGRPMNGHSDAWNGGHPNNYGGWWVDNIENGYIGM